MRFPSKNMRLSSTLEPTLPSGLPILSYVHPHYVTHTLDVEKLKQTGKHRGYKNWCLPDPGYFHWNVWRAGYWCQTDSCRSVQTTHASGLPSQELKKKKPHQVTHVVTIYTYKLFKYSNTFEKHHDVYCKNRPSSSWNTTSKFLLQSDTEKFLVAFRDCGKKWHMNQDIINIQKKYFKRWRAPAGQTTHRVENGVTADFQTRFYSRPLGVNVPELSLEKAHFVLKCFWAS